MVPLRSPRKRVTILKRIVRELRIEGRSDRRMNKSTIWVWML